MTQTVPKFKVGQVVMTADDQPFKIRSISNDGKFERWYYWDLRTSAPENTLRALTDEEKG